MTSRILSCDLDGQLVSKKTFNILQSKLRKLQIEDYSVTLIVDWKIEHVQKQPEQDFILGWKGQELPSIHQQDQGLCRVHWCWGCIGLPNSNGVHSI